MSAFAGPQPIPNGLVLNVDAATPKSYSVNIHPRPLDIGAWATGGNAGTYSRDATVTDSPIGGVPLKMIVSAGDPYTSTYNSAAWNLGTVASGQTWTVSVWAKASVATNGEIFIFGADAGGTYIEAPAGGISITTTWQRFSYTHTFANAGSVQIQTRLDGPNSGFGVDGTTRPTIWWDGLQVERGSAMTAFTPLTNTNGTTWNDLSGTRNKGTLTNGPTYSSGNSGSIVFDGVNDVVLINDSGTLTSASSLTINTWFNLTSFPGAIIGKGTSDADEEYVLQIGSNYVYFDVGIGSGPYTQPATTFNAGTWYNVAVVHTRAGGQSSMTIYINGVVLSNTVINPGNTPNDNAYPVSIGSRFYNSASAPVAGKISVVQLYNVGLTAAQVLQNFNALRSRFGI